MKRMLCILAATMILAVFMTGCGDRGKIGNGENGTYSDNATQSTEKSTANGGNATENRTDNTTNGNTNGDNTNGNNTGNDTTGTANGNNNDSGAFDDNNDGTEQNTDNSDQEGIAGRVGDAIDNGVSGIAEGLAGNDNNNSDNNNSTQPMQ